MGIEVPGRPKMHCVLQLADGDLGDDLSAVIRGRERVGACGMVGPQEAETSQLVTLHDETMFSPSS